MTLDLPRLVVTHVPDDIARDRWLDAATDVTAGVLAVTAHPPTIGRRPYMSGFIIDAFKRLGHQGVEDPGKYSTDPYQLVPYLLVAGITDLVVQHAQWLGEEGLEEVRSVAELCGLRLWLVMHPDATDAQLQMIAGWLTPDGNLDEDDFVAALKRHLHVNHGTVASPWPPPPDRNPDGQDVWPSVPSDDVFTFRATCRQVLTPHQHRQADKRFMQARDDTILALRNPADAAFDAAADGKDGLRVFRTELVPHLSGVLANCADANEATIAVRGVQLALLHLGVFLQVDLDRFEMYALGGDVDDFTVDERGWHRLAAYYDPTRPAVAALYVTGVDVDGMRTLTVDDVNRNGAAVQYAGHRLTVPRPARVYLRAVRLARLAEGAMFDDPLLANPSNGPLAAKTLVKMLHEPRHKLHVQVVPPQRHRKDKTARRWLRRRGLTLRSLA